MPTAPAPPMPSTSNNPFLTSPLTSPVIPDFDWGEPAVQAQQVQQIQNQHFQQLQEIQAKAPLQPPFQPQTFAGGAAPTSPQNGSFGLFRTEVQPQESQQQSTSHNPFVNQAPATLDRSRSRYRKTTHSPMSSPPTNMISSLPRPLQHKTSTSRLQHKSSKSRLRVNTDYLTDGSDNESPGTPRSAGSATRVIAPSTAMATKDSLKVMVEYMDHEPRTMTIKNTATVDYLLQLCQVKFSTEKSLGGTLGGSLVYEIWEGGMLRELRPDEQLKKTVDSWPRSSHNYIKVSDKSISPRLPQPQQPVETELLAKVQYYRDMSSWKTMYMYMSVNLGLILSKKESDAKLGYLESAKAHHKEGIRSANTTSLPNMKFKHKDARLVSLRDFQIYHYTELRRKAIKAPKQFTLVLKSLQNIDYFENRLDSMFVFSTNDVALVHSIIRIVGMVSTSSTLNVPLPVSNFYDDDESLAQLQNRLGSTQLAPDLPKMAAPNAVFNKNSLLDKSRIKGTGVRRRSYEISPTLSPNLSPQHSPWGEEPFNNGGLLHERRFSREKIYKQTNHVNPLAKDRDIIKQDSLLGRAMTTKRLK